MTKRCNKYEMYIVGSGWVRGYNPGGLVAGERRRYKTDTFYGEKPLKMNIEQIVNCIIDCNDNEYNNKSFVIEPSAEFLKEFEIYKKTLAQDEKERILENINKKNPLKHVKRTIKLEQAGIGRNYYDVALKNNKQILELYYYLKSNYGWTTSMIVGYKKTINGYIIETHNSFYEVKEIAHPSFCDTLKELDNYFKSKEFKEIRRRINKKEKEIFNNKIIKNGS